MFSSAAISQAQNGILLPKAFDSLYKDFPQQILPQLRSLLIKFDVAHELEGSDSSMSSLLLQGSSTLAEGSRKVSLVRLGTLPFLQPIINPILNLMLTFIRVLFILTLTPIAPQPSPLRQAPQQEPPQGRPRCRAG